MNSQLYDKTYKVPSKIIEFIQVTLTSNPSNDGIKRAKNIVKSQNITYQNLKRLKNFFDYFNHQNGDQVQYNLAGGKMMEDFVNSTLQSDRDTVERSKENKRDIDVNYKSASRTYGVRPNLTEDVDSDDNVKHNAIAVIVDLDNRFLLLKRAEVEGGWGNNQWSLVGGGVEPDETPEDACKREISEETKLKIDKLSERFVIQRDPNEIEYIFACRYDGDPMDVKLNEEHTDFGWYTFNEIDFLDTVPNLKEYISITFTKY